MTDWPVLDVALGLTVVYTAASLLCSSLNEAIASLLGRRAGFLEQWLRNVLTDPDGQADAEAALDTFYEHPLIRPLLRTTPISRRRRGSARQRRPSYLPATTFVSALLNLTPGDGTRKRPLDELVQSLPPSHAKRAVAAILQDVGRDEAALRRRLETWYDQSMERVSGWYKRRAQLWLAGIGLIAACVLNIDSLQIADTLWAQPNVRNTVVASASKVCCTDTSKPSLQGITETVNYLNSLNAIKLPIGWDVSSEERSTREGGPSRPSARSQGVGREGHRPPDHCAGAPARRAVLVPVARKARQPEGFGAGTRSCPRSREQPTPKPAR